MEEGPKGSDAGVASASRGIGRWRPLFAFAIAAAALIGALLQDPRPDVWARPSAWNLSWWAYPIEYNAFLRNTVIGANVHRLFYVDATGDLWAAGSDGLLARSRDEGLSWEQADLSSVDLSPTETGGTPRARAQAHAPSGGFGLVRRAHAAEAPKEEAPNVGRNAERQSIEPQRQVQYEEPSEQKVAPTVALETPTPVFFATPTADVAPTPEAPGIELNDVWFDPKGRVGIAVGNAGLVLRTEDQGDSWAQREAGTETDLASVAFSEDSGRLWTVGDEGLILRSDDRGESWVREQVVGGFLRTVACAGSGDVCWAGGDGLWLRSGDRTAPWVLKDSGLYNGLDSGLYHSLAVANDGGRVWASTTRGLLSSGNGGRSWALRELHGQRRSFAKQPLGPIHGPTVAFSRDGLWGWVIGHGDALQIVNGSPGSEDRGWPLLWTVEVSASGAKGWAAGASGLFVSRTTDQDGWTLVHPGIDIGSSSVAVSADGKTVWMTGYAGGILVSSDSGRTWHRQPIDAKGESQLVAMDNDARTGVVSVWFPEPHSTQILTTEDRWNTNTPAVAAPPNGWFTAVASSATGARKFAVDFGAGIYRSSDAQTWEEATQLRRRIGDTEVIDLVSSIASSADGSTVVVGGQWGRGIAVSRDGGDTWLPYENLPVSAPKRDVAVSADGKRMLAVGDGIAGSTDGGLTWVSKPNPSDVELWGVALDAGGTRGVAVGENGTIITSNDGGDSWTVRQTDSGVRLQDVDMSADGRQVVAVGPRRILTSEDGGVTWSPVEYTRPVPAPWFFVVLLGSLMLGFFRLPGPEPDEGDKAVIAGMAASDRPLRPGDSDPLEVGRLAVGVARFLANAKTEPPLTIAITGDWGTGKSSIMNLVRGELWRYGFQSVWFNAWHHQTEEHLLASLSESIRRSAPWIRNGGPGFRMRLFWTRTKGQMLFIALLAAATLVAFEIGLPEKLVSNLRSLLYGDSVDLSSLVLSLAASLVVIPGWLVPILRGGTTFGVSATWLGSWLLGRVHVSRVKANTGLRHEFAKNFREVTDAMKRPGRSCGLVLFIDDLDRCRHDNVVSILEMVNFLVSSGDCYIILGMAPRQVEGCVGLGFKEVATQLAGPNHESEGTARQQEQEILNEYARNYLEKLINLAVPVPLLDADGTSKMLTSAAASARPERSSKKESAVTRAWRALGRFIERHGETLMAAATMILLIVLASLLAIKGYHTFKPSEITPRPTPTKAVARELDGDLLLRLVTKLQFGSETEKEAAETTLRLLYPERAGELLAQIVPSPTAHPTEGSRTPPPETPAVARKGPPVIKGQTAGISGWWSLCLTLVALVFVARFITDRPLPPEDDSPDFVAALKQWRSVIHQRGGTPRGVKRFVNRLRYYAMRQRAYEPRLRWTEKLLVRLGWLEPPTTERPPPATAIPPDALVALGAMGMSEAGESDPSIASGLAALKQKYGAARWDELRAAFARLSSETRLHG